MFEKNKEDLIEYCFRFMIAKEMRLKFLDKHNVICNTKNLSAKDAAETLRKTKGFIITEKQVTKFIRDNWSPPDKKTYLAQLKSGLLKGHNWHGAMPSFLHLSFQEKVRSVCAGKIDLKDYLEMSRDIGKQEFFIVVTHDLCESHIIASFDDIIPSIANKSVSDFILKGMPYDLKNSGLPNGWDWNDAKKNPLSFAKSLYEGADTERLRKQAENSINDWGLNRFYVILKNVDDWLTKPEKILENVATQCKSLKKPLQFKIDGLTINCQVIFVD